MKPAEALAHVALRYFGDIGLLPPEPKERGKRAIYARDLLVMQRDLALRLEGALVALHVTKEKP